ncbi:metallophosphoesterase [Chitinivorax sp. PXF-14]|uniref:metallophosphoesterase n=1 Tax=Chitinivorax sp. PXF-14 TaxID=3230488 RepID=UPI003467BA6E
MPPRSFLVIATSLIALLHAYIGWQILPDLPFGTTGHIAGIAGLVLSTLLMPLGLLSRAIHRQPLSDRLAWAGLLAMGLFSSLLVLTVLRDLSLLAVSALLPAMLPRLLTPSAEAVLLLAALITLVGLVNARRRARVKDVDVPLRGLPEALNGFTIAQISDIHVGPTIKRRYLEQIVDAVNALDADLIAVTGDLVDGSVPQLASHTAPLERLVARHGSYFVTGNHEYYSGAHAWIAELRRLGLTVLMNEHVVVEHGGASLVVAGVTDYSAHQFDPSHRSDPQAALAGAPADVAVKLLLAHQPRSASAAAQAGFDLQLSGHTHGGQFLPWNLFVPLQQPFTAGLHRLQALWVYVSRGTGYWGPPKRFGAPSEITRLRLVPAAD